jgi:hypothetical protein
LVREVSVSTRDEARELESGRLTGGDSASPPAELPLCLLLTEATEGHLAFGAGTLVEDRPGFRIELSAQRPVRPERFSHIGTRFVGVVLTNSGIRRGRCGTPVWVEHPTGEQRMSCLERPEAARRLEDMRGGSETPRCG